MGETTQIVFLCNRASQRWLDGDTTKPAVRSQPGIMTFAAQHGCNYTGTGWWIKFAFGFEVHVICMGSDAPNRYLLDGLTETGEVKLTLEKNSGTFWTFERLENYYLIRCEGTGVGDHRLLQVFDNRIRLRTETEPVDDTVLWTVNSLVPVWPL